MELKLLPISEEDIIQFKLDMQEAFQLGATEGGYPDEEEILPEKDIDLSLKKKTAIAYKAVMNGKMVGGAMVDIHEENSSGYLDFLYVKHGIQSKGIGKFIWFEIERLYPHITLWETCTPYFERRNIHFYVNVCGFYIFEFINQYHKNPDFPEDKSDMEDDGMFYFRKLIKN